MAEDLRQPHPVDGRSRKRPRYLTGPSRIVRRRSRSPSAGAADYVQPRKKLDLSADEIAATQRIPNGTVKSRLNRGRAELARLLKRHQVALA